MPTHPAVLTALKHASVDRVCPLLRICVSRSVFPSGYRKEVTRQERDSMIGFVFLPHEGIDPTRDYSFAEPRQDMNTGPKYIHSL